MAVVVCQLLGACNGGQEKTEPNFNLVDSCEEMILGYLLSNDIDTDGDPLADLYCTDWVMRNYPAP